MNIAIEKERETPLLSRKRVTAMMDFQGATPSRLKIREDIAKKLNVDKELTIIKHVYTRYGAQKARVIAHVYDKKEDLQRFEHDYLKKKHVEKKEEKAEAPEKKEEASE